MLAAVDVSLALGGRTILDGASLVVGPGHRVGVVGPNGVGKSTLLGVLAGTRVPDSGAVERSPASTTVGLMGQEHDARPGETLRRYLTRRTGVEAAADRLDALTERLATDPDVIDEYSAALEELLALGGDDLDARIGAVLAEVGLSADRLDVAMSDLSGGQRARAALAAILLARFDVLLLDEPTNDLDFAGLDRLERFVRDTPAAVVLVSHDREFLDRTVRRIVEIEEHSGRTVEFAGGWQDYVAARRVAREQQSTAHAKYEAQRAQLTARARTQRSWSDGGVTRAKRSGEPDKFIRHHQRQTSEQQAAKARTTEKALTRLEARPVEKPWEGWELRLAFGAGARSGDVVARLDGAVVTRGAFALGPVDLELGWQDRLGVVGANGTGKTTLLRALVGELPLARGDRWVGPSTRFGVLDQGRLVVADGSCLLDGFVAETGMVASQARSLLAKLGLGADDVLRPAAELSPGERTRAQLARFVALGVNCLVLDEPTNHLDLPAIEQLETALASYDGTLVVVSHDRRFLDALHLTRTLTLPPA